jgi:arsenical pump membrane protein
MLLISHLILACAAVAALVIGGAKPAATVVVVALAAVDLALGADIVPTVETIAPLLAFLAAAMTLAGVAQRSGLVERVARALVRRAGGSAMALYALVCTVCLGLTATVSLDGAVVLMIPLLKVLSRRYGAPFAPMFLGSVIVSNVASIAVPQGNPTNLVLINRLGLSPAAFIAHMLAPALLATALCVAVIAVRERRILSQPITSETAEPTAFSRAEKHALCAFMLAALTAWIAPLLGVAPWWPFTAAVAVALATQGTRPRLVTPWRVAAQVGALLVVISATGLTVHTAGALALPMLLALAGAIGAAAALANNLPVSVCIAGLLTSGASAYAASIGLAIGSLAMPQGSVATLVATDLAGSDAPALSPRGLIPIAITGVVAATLTLYLAI